MAERQEFSFTAGELGIVSTEELIEAGENFLSSDPNDLKFIPKAPKKKQEEEEESEEDDQHNKKHSDPKKKTPKEVHSPSRELADNDLFSALDNKEEDEDENEEVDEASIGKAKKVEKETITEESSQQAPEEENIFSSIAAELLNHGIFNLDEDEEELEIETPEQFLERFQLEYRKHAANTIEGFLGRFGEDYRDMFENVFVKGIPPSDYLSRYTKIQSVKGLDLTDENNQEKIVRELYRSEGRSSEYIEKKITQLKNYNDLHEEATEAQRILVEREEASIQEEAERKQTEAARKQTIKSEYVGSMNRILAEKIKNKEFDGIPVDRKFAEQTFSYLTQEKFQTPDKQLLTTFDKDILDLNRPENHELKVKVAMLLQILKEDPQLTKLAKKAVSKESSKLFDGIRRAGLRTKKETTKEDDQSRRSFFDE